MIEVFPDLFIGGDVDYDALTAGYGNGWFVISAAKEPQHRIALGYTERAAPKDHPEYLIARRENHLILNLIDPPDPAYIPEAIIDAALEAIGENIGERKVLVHCNQGLSRSPSIALLYLRKHDPGYANLDHAEGVELFKETHPAYKPSGGMAGYVEAHW